MRALPGLLALLACAGAWAADAGAPRRIHINWGDFPGAAKYELELSASAGMEPKLEKREVKGTAADLVLAPGTYYFRVRGVTPRGEAGPWSEVQGFAVTPRMPEALEPADRFRFTTPLAEGVIPFRWEAFSGMNTYLLEVTDRAGTLLKAEIESTEYSWRPTLPGDYQWRVGLRTQVGERWGPPRTFQVTQEALPNAAAAALPRPKPVLVVDALEDPEQSGERPQEWWALARLAESAVVYSVDNKDSGADAGGAAFVRLASLELRWRQARKTGQNWTLSGALNFEMVRQEVLDETLDLPRFYGRVFIGREYGKWRIGPFLQLGTAEGAIFLVDGPFQSRAIRISRKGVGVGGVVVYRTSPSMVLSGLALVRRDFGGESSQLPSPMASNLAVEAGFGLGLSFSPRWMMEGRLRALQEKYSWQAANGSGESSVGNVFIILDVGVGYRF